MSDVHSTPDPISMESTGISLVKLNLPGLGVSGECSLLPRNSTLQRPVILMLHVYSVSAMDTHCLTAERLSAIWRPACLSD